MCIDLCNHKEELIYYYYLARGGQTLTQYTKLVHGNQQHSGLRESQGRVATKYPNATFDLFPNFLTNKYYAELQRKPLHIVKLVH